MSTVSWKNNKRKRSRKTKTEIYPSHQVKWELTGSLMLHAQNKEDSSLCSSVNVWESFVCSSAIHWELQLQDSSLIPSEMCPRCSLALQEAWQADQRQAAMNCLDPFPSLSLSVPKFPQASQCFCFGSFPSWRKRVQATLGMVKVQNLREKSPLVRNSCVRIAAD